MAPKPNPYAARQTLDLLQQVMEVLETYYEKSARPVQASNS